MDDLQARMAAAFDEWMRRYIADPTAFEAEFQSVVAFLAAEKAGEAPTYGQECAAYLASLMMPAGG